MLLIAANILLLFGILLHVYVNYRQKHNQFIPVKRESLKTKNGRKDAIILGSLILLTIGVLAIITFAYGASSPTHTYTPILVIIIGILIAGFVIIINSRKSK